MGVKLLIVDPQMDFMDRAGERGALAVEGADADMRRLAGLIRRLGSRLEEIYVTMDTHDRMDIAHPGWWRGRNGEEPAPFSTISAEQAESGEWRASRPRDHERSVAYLKALEASGRRAHTIWPEHCVKGTRGREAHPELMEALMEWERATGKEVSWVSKGENPFTENFSGFKAEVPDPSDPKTMMNTGLADAIARGADSILIAGEALSHCVAETARDLADHMGPGAAGKLALIGDACSPVGGCEALGEAFIEEMLSRGARVVQTDSPEEELGVLAAAGAPRHVKTRSIGP